MKPKQRVTSTERSVHYKLIQAEAVVRNQQRLITAFDTRSAKTPSPTHNYGDHGEQVQKESDPVACR